MRLPRCPVCQNRRVRHRTGIGATACDTCRKRRERGGDYGYHRKPSRLVARHKAIAALARQGLSGYEMSRRLGIPRTTLLYYVERHVNT